VVEHGKASRIARTGALVIVLSHGFQTTATRRS